MTRTLVIILNHNLPDLTDDLYLSLKEFRDHSFDLVVMDNGSLKKFQSKHSSIYLPKNVYWGGALNVAFKMVLENSIYDSLLFLNNDIEVNGANFVQSLRTVMFENDYAIVSPCIAGKAQPWKQMQCWGSKTPRIVKWIDNQAPLFNRKIIEKIIQFDDDLIYGWGQELVCYKVCQNYNWEIVVCDFISMIHFGQQTIKRKRLLSSENQILKRLANLKINVISENIFRSNAKNNYTKYFRNWNDFEELVEYGHLYSYETLPLSSQVKIDVFRYDLINHLISKYALSTYLEIGVDTGENFERIIVEKKTSVDPVSKYPATHILPSDDFFKNLDPQIKFDLIFIDGLHTAIQVKRDIQNALNHLSVNGFILVHDCNPHLKAHQTLEPTIDAWTGEVWRGFMHFRQNDKNLFACVVDTDWGVGIIHKGEQNCFSGKNLSDIDFEYFDKNRVGMLNLISVDEFLEIF